MLLKHYIEQGVSIAALALRFSIHRRTIERWIKAGQLERALDEPTRYRARPAVPCKLDSYRPLILARLEAFPALSAVRLLAIHSAGRRWRGGDGGRSD